MTVTAAYTPLLVPGDDETVEFSCDFVIQNTSDLEVVLVDREDDTDYEEQEEGVDYTVAISSSTGKPTITFVTAPPSTVNVSGRRVLDTTQPTNIPAGGLFREQQIENALDRIVMLIQNVQEIANRAILVSEYSGDEPPDYVTLLDEATAGAISSAASAEADAAAALAYMTTTLGYKNSAEESATAASESADAAAQSAIDAAAAAMGVEIASTEEAQLGVNDLHYMTPAKTKTAIDAMAVKISGTQTISGVKTFVDAISFEDGIAISGVSAFGAAVSMLDDVSVAGTLDAAVLTLNGAAANAASGVVTLDTSSIVKGKRKKALVSKSNNTVYQAEADGEVYAMASTGQLVGSVGTSSPPSTQINTNETSGSEAIGISFSVAKGEYWKVTGASIVSWRPEGD